MIPSLTDAARNWRDQRSTKSADSASLAGYAGRLSMMMGDLALDAAELDALSNQRAALGITPEQARELHLSAFHHMASVVMADGTVTEAELEGLGTIVTAFGLSWNDLPANDLRTLKIAASVLAIQNGNLPVIPRASGRLSLSATEVLHGETLVQVLDERVIARQYTAGTQGISFRIYKGIRYHVGGIRGKSIPQTAIVVVDQGALSVTSERIAFVGEKKNFSVPWSKVLSAEPLANGLHLAFTNRAKPWSLQFQDTTAAEVFAALVSHYLS